MTTPSRRLATYALAALVSLVLNRWMDRYATLQSELAASLERANAQLQEQQFELEAQNQQLQMQSVEMEEQALELQMQNDQLQMLTEELARRTDAAESAKNPG